MKYFTEIEYHVSGKDERSFQPHNDQAIEIIQTWSNDGYFLVDNHIYPIQPGAVYIINAIETHCSNPQNPETYTRSKIIVDSSHFFSIMDSVGLGDMVRDSIFEQKNCFYSFPPKVTAPYDIDRFFKDSTLAASQNEPYALAKVTTCLIQILLHLFEHGTNKDVEENKNDHILNTVIEYINQNINEPQNITLDRLCDKFYISKSHICHLFKKTTGLSVMQYVNNLRITKAKKLLLTSDIAIQDLATLLGYSSSTLFCKSFKKHTACSPLQYRTNNQMEIYEATPVR